MDNLSINFTVYLCLFFTRLALLLPLILPWHLKRTSGRQSSWDGYTRRWCNYNWSNWILPDNLRLTNIPRKSWKVVTVKTHFTIILEIKQNSVKHILKASRKYVERGNRAIQEKLNLGA